MATQSSNSAASVDLQRLVVVSYNLHGYNQGCHGVKELIEKIAPSVIMIQEHWLTPDNLYKLNSLSDDYFVFGSSAMNARVCSGPLIGRPFGGNAILISKRLVSLTVNLVTNDRFTAVKIADWLFVSVYLPCQGTTDRDLLCCEILSEIEALIVANSNCHCCIAGDYNTDLNCNSASSVAVNNFIRCNNLSRCDVLFPSANRFTYVNETTNTE
jgi:exonuclease III